MLCYPAILFLGQAALRYRVQERCHAGVDLSHGLFLDLNLSLNLLYNGSRGLSLDLSLNPGFCFYFFLWFFFGFFHFLRANSFALFSILSAVFSPMPFIFVSSSS